MPVRAISERSLNHLCLSSCSFDLFYCGLAEFMSLDSEFLSDFAVTQDLDAVGYLLYLAICDQKLRCNFRSVCIECIEVCDIQNGPFLLEYVCEASLRNSSVKRHLAAFKSESYTAAASG